MASSIITCMATMNSAIRQSRAIRAPCTGSHDALQDSLQYQGAGINSMLKHRIYSNMCIASM